MAMLVTSARVDVHDLLRIRWDEPPTGDVTLVLRRRGAEHTVPLDDGAADLSGLELAEGTWSVHVAGQEVITTDPGFSLDGLAAYARRRRGRAIHAFRHPSGGLRLAVRRMEPYAEATAVHPGETSLVIEGYFAFGDAPADAEITAIRRETGHTVTGDVTVSGDRWRAELPNAPFAAEPDRGFWDLRLGTLTIATLLDDIPQKKHKVRFPARYVERATDRVRVRAYYTDHDHLAVATTVVAAPESAGDVPPAGASTAGAGRTERGAA